MHTTYELQVAFEEQIEQFGISTYVTTILGLDTLNSVQ